MKWFRHFSDAHTNEGLRKLRAAMGNEGLGIWWTVLEIIAAKMDETDRCHAAYSVQDWCSFLGVRQQKLSLFLVLTEFELGLKSSRTQDELRIECRKLLELRDEWSQRLRRDSRATPAQSQSQSQSQKENTIPPPSDPPQAKTGVERPGGSGGVSVSLEPEGRIGGGSLNQVRQVAESLGVEIQTADPSLAPRNGYANKSDYHRDFVKEQLARFAAERKAENERIDRETAAGVGKWTAEFASLIKNCDLETRDEIRTAIANLKSQDQLQDTLDKAKQFIESGQSKSPKGLILHRIKQLG